MIRVAQYDDVEQLASIYNHYIDNTIITFETEAVSEVEIRKRLQETTAIGLPWLVAESDGVIAGYAYAGKWKGRQAYRFSVEVTVYLDQKYVGEGMGTHLYQALFDALRKRSCHAAIAGIALPNAASVALHEKLGMEKVAHFKQVGFKFDQWIDVGYWQLLLDRDSLQQE